MSFLKGGLGGIAGGLAGFALGGGPSGAALGASLGASALGGTKDKATGGFDKLDPAVRQSYLNVYLPGLLHNYQQQAQGATRYQGDPTDPFYNSALANIQAASDGTPGGWSGMAPNVVTAQNGIIDLIQKLYGTQVK